MCKLNPDAKVLKVSKDKKTELVKLDEYFFVRQYSAASAMWVEMYNCTNLAEAAAVYCAYSY